MKNKTSNEQKIVERNKETNKPLPALTCYVSMSLPIELQKKKIEKKSVVRTSFFFQKKNIPFYFEKKTKKQQEKNNILGFISQSVGVAPSNIGSYLQYYYIILYYILKQ